MRPLDRRLLSSARSARGHLAVTAAVTTLAAVLVLAQAFAVAELVVRPFQQGADVASLRAPLLVLAGVVIGRALLAWAAEVSAHRISAEVKYSLRQQLLEHVVRLGPAWLSGKATGELATLATRGTDALDAYFARYLPAAISAAVVPPVVVAVVLSQDLLAGLIILATLPLVPVFAILVGTATQRRARSRWRTLSTLGAHFLDVVEGLPTLLVFRRARAQVETIRRVMEENRRATMATLRVAFLSSAVLEFVTTISVALVAVSTGLRLVGGTMDLRTGLVVIVLAPEAYWPLRQLAVHFHDSADGLAAAERVFAILDTPVTQRATAPVGVRCDLSRSHHPGRGAHGHLRPEPPRPRRTRPDGGAGGVRRHRRPQRKRQVHPARCAARVRPAVIGSCPARRDGRHDRPHAGRPGRLACADLLGAAAAVARRRERR